MNIINNCNPVLINTRKYFNYLFNSGYLIKKYSFKQTGMILWRVLLEGPNCLIQISQDRREILLSFSPKNALREEGYNFWLNDQICIQPMIFYLTKGEKAVCLYDDSFYKKTKLQFFFLSELTKEYHDQIVQYFTIPEFFMLKGELEKIKNDYTDFIVNWYVDEKHARDYFIGSNFFINKNKY